MIASVRGASRAFGEQVVLRDATLQVPSGAVTGLIGPNGGGKSTLLFLLAGLLTPTSGEVTVDGLAATRVALERRGTVGLITAEPGLYPLLTGRENLRFFGGLYGLSAAEVDARAAPFLSQLELEAHVDRPVSGWSSGMRQKLSLARALLMRPKLLLLDEPTANLDPLAARVIHEAVRAEADRGTGVVLATHDLGAAEAICEQVALVRGTVVSVEQFPGPRTVPAPGRLLSLYGVGNGAPHPGGRAEGAGGGEERAANAVSAARDGNQTLLIASREWLEQRRQPAMLGAIGALFGVIAGVACLGVYFLDRIAENPDVVATMAANTGGIGAGLVGPDGVGPLASTIVGVANWLVFTQYLGICAVLAGHALLHDREKGTLPFLLLAPTGRVSLLVGKVLGALGAPTAMFVVVDGLANAFLVSRPIHVHAAALLPPSPAWFVAFFVGAPAWAAFVSTVCALVSSAVADVRTAQQIVWLVMFFATFACGFALTALLPEGAGAEAVVAGFGIAATAIAVWGGASSMRRDVSR